MKIELRGVSKVFEGTSGERVLALDGVDLALREGEFVAVVGPSGCGKSTLLNMIAGFDRPSSGQVLVDGRPVSDPGPDRVMLQQEPALFPWLSVSENAGFGLRVRGDSPESVRDTVSRYLDLVHLGRFASALPHELSGGMKQRTALARALALDPGVLLLDEPFAALDAQTRDILQGEIQEIWGRTKKTVVFVTHNVEEAVRLGDRVILMSARPGRILQTYEVDLARPRAGVSRSVATIAASILEVLGGEIDRVIREEMGDDWQRPENRFPVATDPGLGRGI